MEQDSWVLDCDRLTDRDVLNESYRRIPRNIQRKETARSLFADSRKWLLWLISIRRPHTPYLRAQCSEIPVHRYSTFWKPTTILPLITTQKQFSYQLSESTRNRQHSHASILASSTHDISEHPSSSTFYNINQITNYWHLSTNSTSGSHSHCQSSSRKLRQCIPILFKSRLFR